MKENSQDQLNDEIRHVPDHKISDHRPQSKDAAEKEEDETHPTQQVQGTACILAPEPDGKHIQEAFYHPEKIIF